MVLLISLKKDNSEVFSSNTISQKQSWIKVAEMMCLKGHHFTGDDCDKTFRSLNMRQGISAVLKIYQDVIFLTINILSCNSYWCFSLYIFMHLFFFSKQMLFFVSYN